MRDLDTVQELELAISRETLGTNALMHALEGALCKKSTPSPANPPLREMLPTDLKLIEPRIAEDLAQKHMDIKSKIKALEAELEVIDAQIYNIQTEQGYFDYCNVRVVVCQRKGSISWESIPEVSKLSQEYLDSHRKKATTYRYIS